MEVVEKEMVMEPTQTVWKDPAFESENLYLTKEEAAKRSKDVSNVAYHLVMGFGPDGG